MTDAQETPELPDTAPPVRSGRRRRAARRVAGWAGGLILLTMLAGLGWAALTERTLSAPGFLRDRVAVGLGTALPGVSLGFGDMALRVSRSGQVRVLLRDVALSDSAGQSLGSLSDFSAGVRPWSLVRGGSGLGDVQVSGVFVSLWRAPDGQLAVALGQSLPVGTAAPGVQELLSRLDAALQDPRMRGLRSVTVDSVTLRYEDLRARRGWTVDGGRLQLARTGDTVNLRADVAVLSGGQGVATVALNADSRIGENALRFGLNVTDMPSQDFASQAPALAWLEALRAPISGAFRGTLEEDGTLGPVSATLQIGAGVLQPTDATRPVPFTAARTYFTFVPQTGTLQFDEVSVDSAWGRVTASGRASLRDMQQGLPRRMVGQFVLTDLLANPGNALPEPLQLARAEVDARLDLDPFALDIGRLRIDDPHLPLRASGRIEAAPQGWQVALDARLAQVSPARLLALWPEAVKPRTRDWVSQNVTGGTLRNAQVALRLAPNTAPTVYADFAAEGADIRYSRTLPPLTGASGQVTILDNRLVATVEKGQVTAGPGGPVDVAGSSFVIPDLRIKQPPARLELAARGAITAVLAYLDSGRLGVMQKAGLPVDLARGQVSARGVLEFPLRRGVTLADMSLAIDGRATDVASDVIVRGRALRTDSLAVRVTQDRVRIAGTGTLDDVPFDGAWTQPLGQPGAPGRVEASVTLSDRAARRFGVALPDGLLSGEAAGALTLDLRRSAPARFTLTSDLRGLGASLPAVGWRFGQGERGRLEVAGTLGQPPDIQRLRIEAGGLETDARIVLNRDGKLNRLEFPDLALNGWVRAPVRLVRAGGALNLQVAGGTLDLRRAPFGSGGGGGSGGTALGPMEVALERLQISDSLALHDFRGRFSTRGGLQGSFTGALNGEGAVAGDVVPMDGRSAFRIRSDDAGRVMQSSGILKNARGGALELLLTPASRPGEYDGRVDAQNVRLRNAPAIGALLDAISIVGLLDQLEGPGIYFANVDAEFRLTPQQLILQRSSATGPSMGISLDGYYNLASRELDMQGVLSPIYMLNGIGSLLTRRGEGLVGFNFNIRGAASEPRVAVNPLSVLTPGMFREIFRRRPPEVSQ